MEEDFDFAEMAAKIVMDAERKAAKQEAAQQAVERVVGRVGRFNAEDVPKNLGAYKAGRRRERREEANKYDRREFDLWVSSAKAPRSAMKAFREFDLRFSQLSARDRESVGADKVALFLKSVNERGRVAIFPYLEDDEGAYGLTEDWNEVEWVCHQHDARRSATTRPASGGERRMVRDFASSPMEESS